MPDTRSRSIAARAGLVLGIAALVVTGGYVRFVMVMLLVIGALAGAIGSGIAASRFLDV